MSNPRGTDRGWTALVRHRDLMLLLVPGLATFLIFNYLPMFGVIVAFKDFRLNLGILQSPWNGLDNFRNLFSGSDFLLALRNTLIISGLRLVCGFGAPIALALLINEIRLRSYGRVIQTITYLPHLFSWVVLGGMFLMLLSYRGPVNQLIMALNLDPIPFFSSDIWFVVTLILTGIWQSAGYGAVIYLAAISGIDPGLYEAATVDGAGRWRQMIHVTLPALVPTMIVLIILSLGHILNAGFDQIYNMYNPTVYDVADIIDTYVLRRLFLMEFGVATAAGLFKSVVGLVLVIGANSLARRLSRGEQGVW